LAAELRKEPGVQVEVIDGARGELAVSVDGKEVARKNDSVPDTQEVLRAVRAAESVAAGG